MYDNTVMIIVEFSIDSNTTDTMEFPITLEIKGAVDLKRL